MVVAESAPVVVELVVAAVVAELVAVVVVELALASAAVWAFGPRRA